jgi:hypothetical protein
MFKKNSSWKKTKANRKNLYLVQYEENQSVIATHHAIFIMTLQPYKSGSNLLTWCADKRNSVGIT